MVHREGVNEILSRLLLRLYIYTWGSTNAKSVFGKAKSLHTNIYIRTHLTFYNL
jgi:hypothetical protein